MNISQLEDLINSLKRLQTPRWFHCEYLVFNNEGIVFNGATKYFVGSLTPISSEIIQNIKDYILRSVQQEDVYARLNSENIVLGAFIELEEKFSETKNTISRERMAEVITNIF